MKTTTLDGYVEFLRMSLDKTILKISNSTMSEDDKELLFSTLRNVQTCIDTCVISDIYTQQVEDLFEESIRRHIETELENYEYITEDIPCNNIEDIYNFIVFHRESFMKTYDLYCALSTGGVL